MSTYRELLKDANKRMEEADRGEQAALLYLLELTNMAVSYTHLDVYKRQVQYLTQYESALLFHHPM